jgi:outer membrane lipoprotein SlyB
MAGVFLVLASANIAAARRRQKNGVQWHSLSRGESLWGIESPAVDWVISIIAGTLLLKFALLTGILFFASRFASRHLARKEQESLYACYLDQIDAELEMNQGQAALLGGSPPEATGGVYGPLPGRFQGEHRAHVAKVIAGGLSGQSAHGIGSPVVTLPPRAPKQAQSHLTEQIERAICKAKASVTTASYGSAAKALVTARVGPPFAQFEDYV